MLMMKKDKQRIALLWLRNMAVALGFVIGLFAIGGLLVFLAKYLGTPVFSFVFIVSTTLIWLMVYCYRIAVEQVESEKRREQRILDRLRSD